MSSGKGKKGERGEARARAGLKLRSIATRRESLCLSTIATSTASLSFDLAKFGGRGAGLLSV